MAAPFSVDLRWQRLTRHGFRRRNAFRLHGPQAGGLSLGRREGRARRWSVSRLVVLGRLGRFLLGRALGWARFLGRLFDLLLGGRRLPGGRFLGRRQRFRRRRDGLQFRKRKAVMGQFGAEHLYQFAFDNRRVGLRGVDLKPQPRLLISKMHVADRQVGQHVRASLQLPTGDGCASGRNASGCRQWGGEVCGSRHAGCCRRCDR